MARSQLLLVLVVLPLLLGAGCQSSPEIDLLKDQAYATRGEVELLADVHRPASAERAPAVLLVHGGSWARGSRWRMQQIAEAVAEHGFVAVNIDYRKGAEHPYPEPLEDVLAAVCWVRKNAARLGVDPRRIALWGYSAGGHLSALAGSRPEVTRPGDVGDLGVAPVQACVLGSSPTDLARFGDARAVRRFLGATPSTIPLITRAASPLHAVHSQCPPTFLYHGRDDWIVGVEHSRLLHEALQAAEVPSQLVETSRGHLTQLVYPDEVIDQALAFLDRWLVEPYSERLGRPEQP
jgi:acetyl esterase/lipase